MRPLALVCTLFLVTAFPRAVGQNLDSGLVAHFPFNGNANDASGNGNDGTNFGATPASDRFGVSNAAFSFDGSSNYVLVANSATFPSTAISTVFWYNRDGFPPPQTGDPQTQTEHYVSKELSFGTYLYSDSTFASQVWKGTAGDWTAWGSGDFRVITESAWRLYVSTFDNTSQIVRTYIDGVLVDTYQETDPNAIVRTSSYPMLIGRNGSASVYFIQGRLDDVRIYDRVLTPEEVLMLHYEGGWDVDVFHVSSSGDDANPGSAELPLRNIQTALNRATDGDTIKVAVGSYAENLTTSVRVVLVGGYSEDFNSREVFSNKTVLNPASGTALTDAQSSTIDGFHFDGAGGGTSAIAITAGNATVTHNGIYRFTRSGGRGIYVASAASAVVKNNTVANCILSGGGVIFYAFSIAGNAGGGTVVENNISFNNNVGLYITVSGVSADYNCSFSNTYGDYDGTYGSPQPNDVLQDPRLINPATGDLRLRSSSPCTNAGDPADSFEPEPNPDGGRIDLGVFGGTSSATGAGAGVALHVSPAGNDLNDGSIASPLRTIQQAVNQVLGDTVKVAAGVYAELITLPASLVLLGGYDESFTDSARDLFANMTVIEAVTTTMVTDAYGSAFDGFVFDGKSTIAEVALELSGSSTVTHNVFMNMKTTFAEAVIVSAPVVIRNNTFYNNYYAVWLNSAAVGSNIRNNIFAGNNYGFFNSAADGLTSYNLFYNNAYGNYSSGAGYNAPGPGEITVNPLHRNPATKDFRVYEGSPALDTGAPSDPVGDEQPPGNSRIDMGVYGGTRLTPYYPPIPSAPTLLTPADGATRVVTAPRLTWNRTPETSDYSLQVSTDNGFTNVLVDTVTTDSTLVLPALDAGQTYFWRVSGRVTLGSGPFASPFQFTTTSGAIHVATSGNDGNDGSLLSPLRTIQTALGLMAAGDTVKVAEGVYQEALVTQKTGYLRGSYPESFDEVGRDLNTHTTTLRAVSTNIIYDNAGVSVEGFLFEDPSLVSDELIDVRKPVTIRRNIFRNSNKTFAHAIDVSAAVVIVNNTFYDCYYALWLNGTANGSTVRNNIFTQNNYAWYNLAADGLTAYNILHNSSRAGVYTSPGVGEIGLDPKLVAPASGDFRLQGTSPAINAGDPAASYNDPDGTRNDMGAFSYNEPPAPPQNLTGTAGIHSATLRWSRNSEADVSFYRLYGGTTLNPTLVMATTGSADDTSVTMSDLLFEFTYYFRVTAVDQSSAESDYSNEVSVIPQATPLEMDSLALVALYDSCGGLAWTTSTGWLIGEPSGWDGVTVENGRVVRLDLRGLNLTDTVPSVLGGLDSLDYLDVAENPITGFSPGIGTLGRLRWLDVASTQLTGNDLSILMQFTGLEYLNLNNVQWNAPLPREIGNLVRLKELHIDSGTLAGEIPAELWTLTNLEMLRIANAGVTGSLPAEIGNLAKLRNLAISGNQLSGVIPTVLGNLGMLRSLSLNGNQLSGPIPTSLGNLDSLSYLDIGSNLLTGSIPDELANLTSLIEWHLDNLPLDAGPIPSWLTTLSTLEVLSMEYAGLTGEMPADIANLANLRVLNLQGNQLEGQIPTSFGLLTGLEVFRIRQNRLTGSVPAAIAGFAGLQHIDVSFNLFDELPDMSGLSVLDNLHVEENRLTFEDLEPNIGIASASFTYAPQDSVGLEKDTLLYETESFSTAVTIGGSANVYQWARNAADIAGATDSMYSIPSVMSADAGTYVCRVTNSIATELTLYSRPFILSVFDTVAPPAPQNLSAVPGDNQVTLTWNASGVPDVSLYRIYAGRFPAPAVPADSTAGGNNDTSRVIGNLSNGATYYFRIRAVDLAGNESAFSNEIAVTLPYAPLMGEYQPDVHTLHLLHMNESDGSIVTDLSDGANDGTAIGTGVSPGKFGNARDFNGSSDIIQTPYGGNFGFGLYTVEFWVRLNSLSSPHQNIIGNRPPQGSGTWWVGVFNDGSINADGGSGQVVSSPGDIEAGKWYHVAVSRDGGNIFRIYRNGVVVGEGTQSGDFSSGAGVAIGAVNGGSEYTDGVVDEVRISDVVRTPDEFSLQLPPSTMVAAGLNAGSIELSWQNGGGAVPLMVYYIYRGTDSANVVLIDSSENASFIDTGLNPSTAYWYRVSAVDSTGFESSRSYADSGRTLDPVPIQVTFRVNMGISMREESFRPDLGDIVRVAGSFNGWQNSLDTLRDDDTDSIFTKTISILEGPIEYKYVFTHQGGFVWESDNLEGPGLVNRSFTVSPANATTALVYFDGDSVYTPPPVTPNSPTNLQAVSVSPFSINLTWDDNADNEEEFLIERKLGASGSYEPIVTVGLNVTSHEDTGLAPETEYYYRVRARNTAGGSLYSNEAGATTLKLPPLPPSGLTVDVPPSYEFSLLVSWVDNSGSESGFRLERKTGLTGTYEQIAELPADSISTKDAGLSPATLYYYRVRAFHDQGVSPYSDEASGTTIAMDLVAPTSPVNLQISPQGWSRTPQFTLSWVNPSDITGIASAYYSVGVAPTAGNPGTQVTISNPTLGITASAQGANRVYVYLGDGVGNADPFTAASVLAKHDNTPPVIGHDSTAVAAYSTVAPQAIGIQSSASDGESGTKSVDLHYRRSGTGWPQGASVSFPTLAGGTAQIPLSFLTTNAVYGVDYRIAATDSANNVAYTPVHSINVIIPLPISRTDNAGNPVTQSNVASLPAATPEVYAYRLFSVPFDLDNETPRDIFEVQTGLGSYDKGSWRFFSYNSSLPSSNPFDEYPVIATAPIIRPGRAFFLILRTGTVIKTGSGAVVKAEDLAKTGIPLTGGYNFVGNPLNVDISLDSLKLANGESLAGKTWSFVGVGGTNSGWSPNPTVLKAWEGIVISMGGSAATMLLFNVTDRSSAAAPGPASAKLASPEKKSVDQWTARLSARRNDNGVEDSENVLGVAPFASNGLDREDLTEPPFLGAGMISVGFTSGGALLTHDVRAAGEEGYVWDFVVRTEEAVVPVHLSFDGLDDLDMPVFVFDIGERMAFDMTTRTGLDVNSGNGSKQYRLVYGSREFIEKNGEGIDLVPREMELFQNYPNPFNPTTIVRYQVSPENGRLSGPRRVRVVVYDILGREVALLVDGLMEAGYYEETFDASQIAAGMYVTRLEWDGGAKARKIMVLR